VNSWKRYSLLAKLVALFALSISLFGCVTVNRIKSPSNDGEGKAYLYFNGADYTVNVQDGASRGNGNMNPFASYDYELWELRPGISEFSGSMHKSSSLGTGSNMYLFTSGSFDFSDTVVAGKTYALTAKPVYENGRLSDDKVIFRLAERPGLPFSTRWGVIAPLSGWPSSSKVGGIQASNLDYCFTKIDRVKLSAFLQMAMYGTEQALNLTSKDYQELDYSVNGGIGVGYLIGQSIFPSLKISAQYMSYQRDQTAQEISLRKTPENVSYWGCIAAAGLDVYFTKAFGIYANYGYELTKKTSTLGGGIIVPILY
jgi:hypothetical protein